MTSILAAACVACLILTTPETKDASVTKCRQDTGFLLVCFFFFLSSVITVRQDIVGFHSRDQQGCFSMKTKGSVCIII